MSATRGGTDTPETEAIIDAKLADLEKFSGHMNASVALDFLKPFMKDMAEHARRLERQRDEAVALLRPFAEFAEKWKQKPLSAIGDAVYGIHAGTEWEAVLRRSDCEAARAFLSTLDGGKR